jgi:hypothetical protein
MWVAEAVRTNMTLNLWRVLAQELYNAHVGGRSSTDKHDLEPVKSFALVHVAYETVKLFSCVHSAGGHDKQNILNLELELFHLKCKVFNWTAVNLISLEKKKSYFHTGINAAFICLLFF